MRNVGVHNANGNLVIIMYFIVKIIPMIISGFAIYLGYKLFILGVTGEASLSVESDKVTGQLINAAPGLFFALGGIASLIISIWKGVKIDVDPDRIISSAGPRP